MKLLLKPGLVFSDGKSAIYGLSRRPVEALRACVSVGQPRTAALTVAVEHHGSMPASREVAPLPGDRSARAGFANL
jgi:hypothetical protein